MDNYRELLSIAFEYHMLAARDKKLYIDVLQNSLHKDLISQYYKYCDTDYESMFYTFREKYIESEVIVEQNDEDPVLAKKGMGYVYDFIQSYNTKEKLEEIDRKIQELKAQLKEKLEAESSYSSHIENGLEEDLSSNNEEDVVSLKEQILKEQIEHLKRKRVEPFNIFLLGMEIHRRLYKGFDDLKREERESERERIEADLKRAKETKDLALYKKAREEQKAFSSTLTSYGGQLRTSEVKLQGLDYNVPSPTEASLFFNKFLNPEEIIKFEQALTGYDLFGYIDYCVKIYVDIIKYQPFENGNKRTARSLLNLMFKNRNIPPVYITIGEREAYKEALEKAIVKDDLRDIINFYYFKICDSIYELDMLPYIERKNNKPSVEKGIDAAKEMIREAQVPDGDMKKYVFERDKKEQKPPLVIEELEVYPSVKAAVDWWVDRLSVKEEYNVHIDDDYLDRVGSHLKNILASNINVTDEQLESLRRILTEYCMKKLIGHPFNQVYLETDYGPINDLARVIEETGINSDKLPFKTRMIITRESVKVREGYNSEYQELYSGRTNK